MNATAPPRAAASSELRTRLNDENYGPALASGVGEAGSQQRGEAAGGQNWIRVARAEAGAACCVMLSWGGEPVVEWRVAGFIGKGCDAGLGQGMSS